MRGHVLSRSLRMRRGSALLATMLVGIAIATCAPRALAGFDDPLDTPAIDSALAARGLINGLARAGSRVVAVGQRGHVVYSDDDGQHWTQAHVPVRSDLTAVSFADARHGWAVGHDGVVLATQDAGASWVKQLDGRVLGKLIADYYAQHRPDGWDDARYERLQADAQRLTEEGPDKPFLDVWFADARHGFVVGAFNLMLATDDGGQHWTPWLDRSDNPRALHLYAVRAAGADVYVAGEQGLLLKLDRETQRFRAIGLPYRGTLFGVAGDGDAVTVFGLRGTALRSSDGGASWQKLATDVDVSLTSATIDAEGRQLLLSQTGQVLRTTPQALQPVAIDRRVPASAALALPDGALLIGGPQGLHRITPHLPTGPTP